MNSIGERLLSGIMFHIDLTKLFNFLGLNNLYKWQKCQTWEEIEHLQELENYMLKYHHKMIQFQNINKDNDLIPIDWYSCSTLDVNQNDIINNLQKVLDEYINWEQDTKIFLYDKLRESDNISDKCIIEKIIKSVECELADIEQMRQTLQINNFSISCINMIK